MKNKNIRNVKRMKTRNVKIMKIRICEHNVYREEERKKNHQGPRDKNRGLPCLLCFLFLPQVHGLRPFRGSTPHGILNQI